MSINVVAVLNTLETEAREAKTIANKLRAKQALQEITSGIVIANGASERSWKLELSESAKDIARSVAVRNDASEVWTAEKVIKTFKK
jgi:hypothetical protein